MGHQCVSIDGNISRFSVDTFRICPVLHSDAEHCLNVCLLVCMLVCSPSGNQQPWLARKSSSTYIDDFWHYDLHLVHGFPSQSRLMTREAMSGAFPNLLVSLELFLHGSSTVTSRYPASNSGKMTPSPPNMVMLMRKCWIKPTILGYSWVLYFQTNPYVRNCVCIYIYIHMY